LPDPIIVDVDGVVVDFVSALAYAARKEVAFSAPAVESALPAAFGGIEPFLEFVVERGVLEACPVYDGAVEGLIRIASRHPLVVVTARAYHPLGGAVTKNLFEGQGVEVAEIVLTQPGRPKSSAYRGLAPRFAGIIEDSPRNLDDAYAFGCIDRFFVRDQPWNRGYARAERVKGLTQVAELLGV